jgi:hypothetical protein
MADHRSISRLFAAAVNNDEQNADSCLERF